MGSTRNIANSKDNHSDGQIVREFLNNPLSHDAFYRFFRLSVQMTVGFLAFLCKKGYCLPNDQFAGNDQLNDLANDILGSLLRSAPERPYFLIFNYFSRQIADNLDSISPQKAIKLYKALLFSFARQELSRLKKDLDPQVENLKQRFKVIFRGEAYNVFCEGNTKTAYVKLSGQDNASARGLPLIEYLELLQLVEETYHCSQNRTQWCRKIFERLSEKQEVRKAIKLHEILKAIVMINVKYSLSNSFSLHGQISIDYSSHKQLIISAKSETLEWLSACIIDGFIKKKKINQNLGTRFLEAADLYISDLLYSGALDSKSSYFRDVMPEEYHNRYEDYKYVFSIIFNSAKEHFKNRLKNILCIAPYDFYT